jgi:hypothetical protein
MHHTVPMSKRQRSCHVCADRRDLSYWEWCYGTNPLSKGRSRHKLHNDEVCAVIPTPIEDRDNIRLGEIGGRLSLSPKPLHKRIIDAELGEEHLQRHRSIQQGIASSIDIGHPTARDLLDRFIPRTISSV